MTEDRLAAVNCVEGIWCGAFRRPRNLAAHTGPIHDNEAARALGFPGGFVPGDVLNDQYPPVLVRAFGARWFEQGSFSNYYRMPVYDSEEMRVCAEVLTPGEGDVQVSTWLEDRAGVRRVVGSASVGNPAEKTYLRRRFEASAPPGEIRILRDIKVGEAMPERRVRITAEEQRTGAVSTTPKSEMTEPLSWYWDGSPWGGSICSPLSMEYLMFPLEYMNSLVPDGKTGVAGGKQIQIVNGPIFTDRDYRSNSRFLGVGQSDQTEFVWFESTLTDAQDGTVAATLLVMRRWMKATSPAYH